MREFLLRVDYGLSIDEMVKAANFHKVTNGFTSKDYYIEGTGVKNLVVALYKPTRILTPIEARWMIEQQKGWHPARIEHLLNFARSFRKEVTNIDALGSITIQRSTNIQKTLKAYTPDIHLVDDKLHGGICWLGDGENPQLGKQCHHLMFRQ